MITTPFEQFTDSLRKRNQSRLADLATLSMYNSMVRSVRATNPTAPMNRIHGLVRGRYTTVLKDGYAKISRLEQMIAKVKYRMLKENRLERIHRNIRGNPLMNKNGNLFVNARQ